MSLHGFFRTDVVTIRPDQLVTEAAQLMRDRHVGNVVVIEERGGQRTPVGLLTDRDIALGCVATEVDLAKLKVHELMSTHPVCAKEDDGVYAVVQQMRMEGVTRLPVVNHEGELVGIITSKNILALLTEELSEIVSITETHKEAGQAAQLRGEKPRVDRMSHHSVQ